MDFLIKYNLKSGKEIKFEFCDKLGVEDEINITNITYIEKLVHLDYIELETSNSKQLAMGDVIRNNIAVNSLSEHKGLFYLLTLTHQNKTLTIQSDEHGLLPVYYFEQGNHLHISSSYVVLSSYLLTKTPNPDFYIEQAILYTQLNGLTYHKEIKRLGYGEIIEISNEYKIKSTNRFYNYFTSTPKPFKTSINEIARKFIEISKHYIQEPCAISLTGGFDGRTITACAHYHDANFINFSYGRKGNGDVDNPIYIANKLGLTYKLIELEQAYLSSGYQECVESYIKYSGGLNGFQFPQSLYYVQQLKADRKIIVTGYLGSEILANAKNGDDEVCPQSVLDFLKTGINEANYAYSLSKTLIQLGIVKDVTSITDTLHKLEAYFSSLPKFLSINQKLAVFSFENIYRNTFGVWIYSAMHLARIRVPFMDKEFFEEISKTHVSQFYRNFQENNPIKRIYGQMLYPVILNKTWPEINALASSKGYSPKNILTASGRLKIALNRFLIRRNDFPEKHGLDKMSTLSGAVSYLANPNTEEPHSDIDKKITINLMKGSSVNRALCFLALTKDESMRLFK